MTKEQEKGEMFVAEILKVRDNLLLRLKDMQEEILKVDRNLRDRNIPYSERINHVDVIKLERIAKMIKELMSGYVYHTDCYAFAFDNLDAPKEVFEKESLYYFELYYQRE